jgi:hypothetical protein
MYCTHVREASWWSNCSALYAAWPVTDCTAQDATQITAIMISSELE